MPSTLLIKNYINPSGIKYTNIWGTILATIIQTICMIQKNKKQFGVWMDTHHATVIGRSVAETQSFSVLGYADNAGAEPNTSEKNEHNDEKTLQHKFFKEILTYMQNAEEVHLLAQELHRNS